MSEKQGLPPPPPPYQAPGGYPNQQYPSGYQPQQSSVVVQQPAFVAIQQFRETPVRTTCGHCNSDVITSTHFETGTITWVACLIVAFIGCWFGCCLIPFCVDSCKDVVHSCPNCRATIARYDRM